jgi:glycosyltransferase involved in cell wall biosynthesis
MLTHSVYDRDIRVRRYAEYLADEGHCVDIVCLESESGESQTRHPNIRVFPLSMTRNRKEGLGLVVNWGITALMMFILSSRLDIKRRYDLAHVHNMPDFLVFCVLFQRLRGCPVILNIHDPTPELAQSKLSLPPDHPVIRVQAILEKISIKFSTHIITSTNVFKKKLVERGTSPDKITVIMNAPDSRIFHLVDGLRRHSPFQDHFTILYVGTVARRYGLHIVVEALTLLRTEIPHLRLKVYTKILREGKALNDCVVLARTLGVADLFEVHPPVPLENMPEIMRQADIGVYPALSDCHMDNALSLKIPEMASMGLPIVSTRLSILEEMFGDDCIAFVPPGDPRALAEKILELYHSPDLMDRLAENALARSALVDWESQYRKYHDLLESLVGRNLS